MKKKILFTVLSIAFLSATNAQNKKMSCPEIGLHQNLKKWTKKVNQFQD
jgi:hypothetical protein